MPIDVPLRCQCGKLTGSALDVSPAVGTRVFCYCSDCQAFAHFLEREGITDEWGGTDIFQMAPGKVRIEHDDDALRCVRLSAKGMHRWYCRHCKTPVGNTLGPSFPFVGLITSFIDHERAGVTLDALLGVPVGYIHTRAATGDGPPKAKRTSPFPVLVRTLPMVVKWKLTGAGNPSPFFDTKLRTPRVEPRVLSVEERNAL
jgi:hypothetical protein